MQISNDNISFQSRVKFVSPETFKSKVGSLNKKRHEVGYPWTPETMKKGKNLYTTDIMDCIAGGVVDGGKVTMFHLCTRSRAAAKRTKQKGFTISDFERIISDKINLANENLHAFILGGMQMNENSKYNVNKLNKVKKVFEDKNIPYTIIGARRDVHYFGKHSVFYENKSDTFYITNNLVGSRSLNGKGLEVEIKENSIEYNIYKKNNTGQGTLYERTRKETGVEDYFKSQFRQVKLSKFDKWG